MVPPAAIYQGALDVSRTPRLASNILRAGTTEEPDDDRRDSDGNALAEVYIAALSPHALPSTASRASKHCEGEFFCYQYIPLPHMHMNENNLYN